MPGLSLTARSRSDGREPGSIAADERTGTSPPPVSNGPSSTSSYVRLAPRELVSESTIWVRACDWVAGSVSTVASSWVCA